MRWTPCVAALAIGLCLPAAARAESVIDTYSRLEERDLKPAPLVFTTVPKPLRPLGRTLETGTTIGGRGYALRLQGFSPDAVIEVSGGEFRTMRAFLREARRQGYAARGTRVRGRPGRLLRRPGGNELAWTERGTVYSIGSGTPRSVPLKRLRATAAALDRLEGAYLGGSDDPESTSYAQVVTTRRTVTVRSQYDDPECRRAGQAEAILLRRDGDAFSFGFEDGGWTGTASGTIAQAAVTFDVRATGTFGGVACDTGPLRLTLPAQ